MNFLKNLSDRRAGNTITFFFLLIFLLGKNGVEVLAQTSLVGKVTAKETGEEMIGANIVVTKNGIFIQGESTDIDGNFNILVDPAIYEVEVFYIGYATKKIRKVIVIEGQETKVNVELKIGKVIVNSLGNYEWKVPLIEQDEMSSEQKTTSEQIRNQPTRNIKEILLSTPGVSFSQ